MNGIWVVAWKYLLLARILEAGFTTALRLSEGFSRLGPSLAFFTCVALSLISLQKARGKYRSERLMRYGPGPARQARCL
jgi:hypothetical protein